MRCRECAEARQYMRGSVWCVQYGIILREDHECTREGGKRRDGAEGDGEEFREETELPEDGCGAA